MECVSNLKIRLFFFLYFSIKYRLLFRIVLWSSVGKELSPWLFTCAVFILVPS